MRRQFAFKLLSLLIFIFVTVAAAIVSNPSVAAVYAEDGISIQQCRLLLPDSEFIKANQSDGIVCELWTPTDTELIYYGTDDGESLSEKTRLVVEEKDKAQRVPYNNSEVGNRYEIKVKTTMTMFVLRYHSEADESLNFLGTETFDGKQYFQGKIDGGIPKIAKNSLRTVLKDGNRWEFTFTAEDPSSDTHYFWAQSGLKKIRVVKKVVQESDSEAFFETVKDVTGAELITEFEGVGEGKAPLKRTKYTAVIANIRGDYFVEITDYVGNSKRYSLLNVEESSEPYYDALSQASKYVEDDNLNISIRENVSNALDAFLSVINENIAGDKFEVVHQVFLKAMREAYAAYEKGINCVVSVENGEYLDGTLDAEFTKENYGEKVLLGDTLELRITIAYFDANSYRNFEASALAQTKNASGVLRFNVKMLYNGKEVDIKSPVKIYLGIPSRYRNVSLVYTGASETSVAEMQAGAEWVTFTVGTSGSYDLFFREEKSNLDYLWLLLLVIPIGGTIVFIGIRIKKKNSKSAKQKVCEKINARFGIQEEDVLVSEIDDFKAASKTIHDIKAIANDSESVGDGKTVTKTNTTGKPNSVPNSARYPAAKKKNGKKGGKKR